MPEVPARTQHDINAGLPAVRLGGRFVTKYDPDLALRICERISEGETLLSICEGGSGLPCRQTFYRWAVVYPELARAYATARELSAHSLEEEALDMARRIRDQRTLHESPTVRAYDVALGQLRWSASKRNPRTYSDRAAMTFTVPIQINTSIDLGAGGGQGTEDHPNVYEVEAKVVEDHPDDRPPPTDGSTPLVKEGTGKPGGPGKPRKRVLKGTKRAPPRKRKKGS